MHCDYYVKLNVIKFPTPVPCPLTSSLLTVESVPNDKFIHSYTVHYQEVSDIGCCFPS